jgi:hypothetical protein
MTKSDFFDKIAFNYGGAGIPVGAVLRLPGLRGLFAASFAGFMYVFVLSSSINGLCHFRLQELRQHGRELPHGRPVDGRRRVAQQPPRASPGREVQRAREIDPAWPIIRTLELLRAGRSPKRPIALGRWPSSTSLRRHHGPRRLAGDTSPTREVLADLRRGDNISARRFAPRYLGAHADAPSHRTTVQDRRTAARVYLGPCRVIRVKVANGTHPARSATSGPARRACWSRPGRTEPEA